MKKIILSFIIACSLAGNAFSQTAAEWQDDLRHLQKTVHEKYSNLFHTIKKEDWDKAVDKFHTGIPSMDKMSILTGFVKLVAMFNIGHTQVALRNFHQPDVKDAQLTRYPYRLFWFSDGVHIQAAEKSYEKIVGAKVLSIGNMKTEDALEAIRPLVSYENEQGFKSNCVFFLATPELMHNVGITETSSEVKLRISKDGKEETIVIKALPGNNPGFGTGVGTPQGWVAARKTDVTPLWQKDPEALRYFEYLPESKTVYVRHSVVGDDGNKTVNGFFKEVFDFIDKNDVQKMVLDVRTNGGGNNYLNKNVITGIVAARKINQPGKFFCILGRRSFSAAQNLVNELERYTEVVFVGEPTSENVNFYGDTRTEVLPNSKLPVNLSWMWWQNMDPRDKRKATYPKLATDMSSVDYYNNIDPAMNAIMNYDQSRSLMPTLTRLLEAGKKDEALKFAFQYRKDPINKYFDDSVEPDINNEGYRLLQTGKKEIAAGFFEINTKLFPESANTYDSYAESLMELGKNDEAIKYYEIAIAKDKNGATAENSRRQIEKIKTKKGF